MEEIWKSAKGLEGYYECSNLGNVRSVSRVINISYGNKGMLKSKVLKNHTNKYGYVRLSIPPTETHPNRNMSAHRIVAETWIENPENKPQVNHKNGIKNDNRVENLEWATRDENMRHAHLQGLMKMPKGTDHAMFNIKSALHPRARKVINITTKEVYGCIKDCAKSIGMKVNVLRCKLSKGGVNNTDIIYFDDYVNNNGWVKILSEADLPTIGDDTEFWGIVDGCLWRLLFMEDSKRWYDMIDLNLRVFPTHYQTIQKPTFPIY